jgi:hypothetical protein
MKDFTIYCSMCHTPTKICGKLVYMKCLCNEDYRIIPFDHIINHIDGVNIYLLETTKGLSYGTMEGSST